MNEYRVARFVDRGVFYMWAYYYEPQRIIVIKIVEAQRVRSVGV